MIRKLLAVTVVLFSLFAASAWADEEQYPAKGDDKPEAVDKEVSVKSEGDALAETGSDSLPLVMVASGLIVVGGVLVTSVRRRRTETLAVSV